MRYEVVDLKARFDCLSGGALCAYVLDNCDEVDPNRTRPAVLLCPGGSYIVRSERESEVFAIQFLAKGYHAFVLNYSTSPAMFPTQVTEAAAAVALIRENATEWHIDPDKIVVAGFSAGGHLAASLATMWNRQFLADSLKLESEFFKPNALVLSYPVITSGEFAHKRSFEVLLGNGSAPASLSDLSLEKQVGPHVPQTFLWHTLGDTVVPCENSFLFAQSLRKNNVPFELHIFPEGGHGLALANTETAPCNRVDKYALPHTATWFELCCDWLKTRFE